MHKNELLSQEDVKKQLGITDFRSIKKEQLIEFVSAIPNMDKEVAMACIAQFPEFKDYSLSIVEQLYQLCDKAIESDNKDIQQSIDGYKLILSELQKQLNKRFITNRRKNRIIKDMVEVTDKIAELERDKIRFKGQVLKLAGAVGSLALALAGALLGIRISKK